MASTIQRLTMFALISALERDLRDFLILHVAPLVEPKLLLAREIADKAESRFKKDNPESKPEIRDLIDYLDLGDAIGAVRSHDARFDAVTRSYIRKYYVGMEGLIAIRNRVMHSRPLEFDDLANVSHISAELTRSHRALWANLRTVIRTLERDPEYVTTLTIPDTEDDTSKLLHNLPLVEFDDTGFIGRDHEVAELKRALLGSYPVVTIVGEGGLGKTALALKVCYDLLDDETAKLDAIVWTTAKTTKLTLNEIQVIDGAISSSLGIIENAASLLGRQTETTAIDDLIQHLENNRILLVIDNLETVIDQNIRNVVRRVPQGSRILFTTRIGLGAFDFPIPLAPFNKKESAFYFRRTARVWGVKDLAEANATIVDGYCDKLQHNPLFIKWFIQSVRAGKRPTTLTTDQTSLLKFCLQNVFNYLPREAQAVAQALASISGAQTVAGLAFYTDLDSLSIQSALSHLMTSNIVTSERGRSAEDEDRYILSTLSRLYIQKFIRFDPGEQKRLLRKQTELRQAQEEFSARTGTDIFDLNFVHIRDKDDYIVAKLLTKAIEHIFKKDLVTAETQISMARDLSPNYFEVHRVAAMLCVAQGDYFGAKPAYESALSLAPDRAPLQLWYAGFLSRYFGDHDTALAHLAKSAELAPNSPIVKIERARVLQYVHRLPDAKAQLDSVTELRTLPARIRRVHLDLSLKNYLKSSERCLEKDDAEGALSNLRAAKALFDAAPAALLDERTLRGISRNTRQLPSLRRAFRDLPEEEELSDIEKWMFDPRPKESASNHFNPATHVVEPSRLEIADQADETPPNRGRLAQVHENYCFVDTGGQRFFFHRGSWVGKADFSSLEEGTIVEFEIGSNDKGVCAVNVRPMGQPNTRSEGKTVLGAVKSLKDQFGFIRLDEGGDLFFHRNDCTPTTNFKTLMIGNRVRCRIGRGDDGRTRGQGVELYSGVAVGI